jgi:hypothetical protein
MGLVVGRVAVDTQVRLCFGTRACERLLMLNLLQIEFARQFVLHGQIVTTSLTPNPNSQSV